MKVLSAIKFGGLLFAFAVIFNHMSLPQNISPAPVNSTKFFVYIGTYGKGVEAFRFDAGTSAVEPLGLVGEVVNPSWITTDRGARHLYAVSELEGDAEGGVASFAIDRKSGKLHPLNSLPSGGVAPCYAAVDATNSALVVANYMTGGVSAFPIGEDGKIGARSSLMLAHGSSVNKERQDGPHAHEAVITDDNQRVYVPDLGLDLIRIYRLESTKLVPNDPPTVKGEAGLGPRHIVFSKDGSYAYLINELKPLVSVYKHDRSTGSLQLIQTVPTLPTDFTKETTGAELRLSDSGKFLYTSNRGHDSIQVYLIDHSNGKLRQIQSISSGGETPRGFAIDPTGHFLFVANQKSNNLVVFKIDEQTGELALTGQRFEATAPVDVLFVPAA